GVYICDECVHLCNEIIAGEQSARESALSAQPQWQATITKQGATTRTTASIQSSDQQIGSVKPRRHIIDLVDWAPTELRALLDRATVMRAALANPMTRFDTLRGRVMVNLFYENSTRTRVSFELAGKRMGADVVNVTTSASSVTKGESLRDTVATLQALGASVIVVRSSQAGAPDLIARSINGATLNAGDGWRGHPTQALLDLFTMERHIGSVASKRIVILGDILHSRVARSNIWSLTTMGAEVMLCAPPTLLPYDAVTLYAARPVSETGASRRVTIEPRIERALQGADVVMALRLQRERQQAGLLPSLREYTARYGLTPERLALARPGALVMHPGPMNEGVEIDPAVAHGAASAIEEQVTNGVAIRMAALELIAGALDRREER
ncbi:MAG TPA: aspartate carbamoyltransferase catalytic subunit, partial [Ktedonobacterales bacterium]|nr:aspartate carbamoyltransferase catalytic subunit [Ktedonobacterales bacterium]